MKQYSYEDIPEAWEKVKDLYPKAIIRIKRGYTTNTVYLDPDLTKDLNDFEKIILADNGNFPFGGEVKGNIVTVYLSLIHI